MALKVPGGGVDIRNVFARRPRYLLIRGYVIVWDNSNPMNSGNTVVMYSDDPLTVAQWVRATQGSRKKVWVYRMDAKLIAADIVSRVIGQLGGGES